MKGSAKFSPFKSIMTIFDNIFYISRSKWPSLQGMLKIAMLPIDYWIPLRDLFFNIIIIKPAS